jgi:hypothetical protein
MVQFLPLPYDEYPVQTGEIALAFGFTFLHVLCDRKGVRAKQ